MAATVELSAEVFTAASGTTLETGSVNPAGANRILYVGILTGDAGTPAAPTAVKWKGSGGTSLSAVAGVGGVMGSNGDLRLYRLNGPATGSGTVYAEWSSAMLVRAMIAVFVQDAATGTDTAHEATGTDNTPTDGISGASGDLVLDVASFIRLSAGSPTFTIGAGQTEIQRIDGADLDAGGGGVAGLASSRESSSGGTTTMSWTLSQVPDAWHTILVNIKAAGGGSSPVLMGQACL